MDAGIHALCERRQPPFASGFSLVELMVAMTLSLLLLGGVLAIFASSRTTYETNDRLSRIQESGRFALEVLVRDLRAAGYQGCSRRSDFTNALNTPSVFWNLERPVQGYDAQSGSWSPTLDNASSGDAPNALTGNDALVIRGIPKSEFEPVRVATGMSDTTGTIQLIAASANSLDVGDVVQISDCNARAAFQITANAAGVLDHANGGSEPPGNATNDIGYAFTEFAELVPIESSLYYVANGPSGSPSLYRRVNGNNPEEVVEGVERMQILFGEQDGDDIFYRAANAVTDWDNVLSVRIALLVRSMSEYGADVDQASYNLLGVSVAAPGDRHMRQVFTTTVSIRNRAS